jgi:WD40 repeat protein
MHNHACVLHRARPARAALLAAAVALSAALASSATAWQAKSAPGQDGKGGWEPLATLKGQEGAQWQLAFAPGGKLLAVGSSNEDGEAPAGLRLWDLSSPKPTLRHTLTAPKGSLLRIAFAPDGKTLLAVGAEGMVKRFDAASGKALGSFSVGKRADEPIAEDAWFTASGKTVAILGPQRFGGFSSAKPREVSFWDVQTGKVRRTLRLAVGHKALALSPDGKVLVSALNGEGGGGSFAEVRFWDVASGRPITSARSLEVLGALFSPTGKNVLIQRFDAKGQQPSLVFWYMGGRKARLPRHVLLLRNYGSAYSGDGKRLASLYLDKRTVTVWNLATDRPVGKLERLASPALATALGPDGSILAVAEGGNAVHLWTYREGAGAAAGKP